MAEAVIVGVGETPFVRESPLNDLEFLADGIRIALQDAGIQKTDVDGLAVCANVIPDDSTYLAAHLQFELGWVMKADFGGASAVISIARAQQAIEHGDAEVVVVVGGGNRLDRLLLHHDSVSPPLDYAHRNWVEPYSSGGPNGFFGMIQRRDMHENGTTLEQLGKVAVTFRNHAKRNDHALLRDDLTIEDYLRSPLIADPIRLYDCVMPCAGAVAVVLCSQDYAKRLTRPGIHIRSAAEWHNHQVAELSPDRLNTGFGHVADRLFAGTDRDELDFLQLYDDYPIAVLKTLEGLGFCEQGDGGPFVERTDFSIDGELPINTGGGLLSIGQPRLGAGYIPIVEAVRQLRGEATGRQISGARVGLVSGIGLIDYLANVMVCAGLVLEARGHRG